MKRNTMNAAVDGVLALSGTGLLVTGLLMAFVLPAGSNRTLELWGKPRHDWGEIHLWLAYVVIAAGLVHVALHWTWIVATIRRAIIGKGGGKPSLRLRVVSGCVAGVLFASTIAGVWALASDAVTQRADIEGRGAGEGSSARTDQPTTDEWRPHRSQHQQRRRGGRGSDEGD